MTSSTKFITDDLELSNEFSNFFDNAIKSLNIQPNKYNLREATDLCYPVEFAITKFYYIVSIIESI